MTKISAKIIADSKNEFGNRITTMVVTFPRIILAELNTHRMFSRNSASSRAIPFRKMMDSILQNPFTPIAWQKDHSGMQGTEYITDPKEVETAERYWKQAAIDAVNRAQDLSQKGVTKQIVNRLLEPFMWHTVIITATEYENFFALRCPQYQRPYYVEEAMTTHIPTGYTTLRSRKEYASMCTPEYMKTEAPQTDMDWMLNNKGQAEIHMMALAEAMWDVMEESTPKELKAGEWHIPFGGKFHNDFDAQQMKKIGVTTTEEYNEAKIKIATARCARVSYTIVGEEDKEPNYENDIKLYDRLKEAGHMSPFEHCAEAMGNVRINHSNRENNAWWSGNFKGFIQHRKTLTNENII